MAMLNNQRVQESLYLKIGTLVSGIDFPEKNQSIDEVVTLHSVSSVLGIWRYVTLITRGWKIPNRCLS